MKRTLIVTLALVLVSGLALASLAFAHRHSEAWEGRGHCWGAEQTQGMMGYGPREGMGPGRMNEVLAKLPPEKQEQLRKLFLDTRHAQITQRAELQNKRLTLRETLRAYPLDPNAVRAQWEAMDKIQKQLFEQRLAAMTQAQQIMGQDLWTQMHAGFPFGGAPHGGPGWGPGAHGMWR